MIFDAMMYSIALWSLLSSQFNVKTTSRRGLAEVDSMETGKASEFAG